MAGCERSSDVRSLTVSTLAAVHRRLEQKPALTCSSNSGYGLLALLSHALWVLTGDDAWREHCRRHLDSGVESMQREQLSTSFYRSAPGFGWALAKLGPEVGFEPTLEVVDELAATYQQVLQRQKKISFDLIDGLAGLAVLAREASPSIRDGLLDQIWINLRCLAPTTSGFAWVEPGADDRGADLGLAHGAPGVLAALAAAQLQGWPNGAARNAVLEGGEWLQTLRSENDGVSGYPYRVGGKDPARLGWCYGSASLAVCYSWLAALDVRFRADAIACALDAERQRFSACHGIVDACVCHGESSWAYMGVRLSEVFQGFGCEPVPLIAAARDRIAIESRRDDQLSGTVPHVVGARAEIFDTLLEGAAGVWLAIAGLQDSRCRVWEGMMLLDLPKQHPARRDNEKR